MSSLTPERLSEIEAQLMNIQHELQHVIPVHESIKGSSRQAQSDIIRNIADARNDLIYLVGSIQATLK